MTAPSVSRGANDAAPTETPLVAFGWVERMGESRGRVGGKLCLADGTVLAECESIVVRPQAEFLERWSEEERYWRVYNDAELDAAGC